MLELLRATLRARHLALLHDSDGGHLRERLRQPDVVVVEAPGTAAVEVQCTDAVVSEAEREGVHRPKAERVHPRDDRGPAVGDITALQIVGDHGCAGAVGLMARSIVVVDLGLLQRLHVRRQRRRKPEMTVGGLEHDSCRGHLQQLGAALDEHPQELVHLEVVGEGVGQLDEGVQHSLLALRHRRSLPEMRR